MLGERIAELRKELELSQEELAKKIGVSRSALSLYEIDRREPDLETVKKIQSYPDDYFFRGAYTKTYMQIGNSVPPLLGRAIAHVIKEHMERR